MIAAATRSSVLAALGLLLAVSAHAATPLPGVPGVPAVPAAPVEVPAEPTPAELRELSALLSDPGMVAWLEAQADAAGAAEEAESGITPQEWLATRLAEVEERFNRTLAAWRDAGAIVMGFKQSWVERMGEAEALRSLVYVLVFLIIGSGIEWLYWRYAAGLRHRIESDRDAGVGATALRALLTGVGIVLFAAGTLGAFVSFDWSPFISVLVLSLLLAVVTVRVVNTAVVFVLCPRVPALRPIPIDTPLARFAHRLVMSCVLVGVVGSLGAIAVRETGIAPSLDLLVSSVTATLVAALLIAGVWRWRARFADRAQGRRAALGVDAVPVFATFLVALGWLLWIGGAVALLWTLVIVVLVPLADAATRALTERPDQAPPVADPAAEVPLPASAIYRPVLVRFVRFLLVIAAVVLGSLAWGVDLWSLSGSSTTAGRVFGAAVDITIALLIADLAWVWARTAIDARMALFVPPEPGHAPGPEARLATLLPLVRKVLMITLMVMVVLIGLSSMGINVGPLIAGAGVIGIAVGFGAQTLVRDIVSGVFFLLDDAFRVGEYIEVGELRGTVESISVRSLRLRHHRGAIHTIPFGEMKSLTNHSRDWVIMKLEFRVPFETDLMLVKKLVKKIGQDLKNNDELGPNIIEPLKSQGVRRMEEFNMVVGVKFMTKPGEQWTMRKEAYQRIRDAFDAHGINFAQRNVKVEVVGADPSSPEAREAAVGAAQDAIEQQLQADAPAAGAAAGRQ